MSNHSAVVSGRVAVVTGAASGIGLAAARKLGEAGMRIVLVDIDADSLERAVADLKSTGINARAVRADVSRGEDMARVKTEADAFGEVSVLMNNAAREGGDGLFADIAKWKATLDINVGGVLHGIQLFVPDMISVNWPCMVINTGSKQGITLPPGDTAYNVSKAALRALTESLAHELLATNDRVSAHLLIPGFTYTGLTRARGIKEKPAAAWTAEQVVEFMWPALARGDFYILCPDNDVARVTDEKRIRWAADDIIKNRPALSRWHPDYKQAFADHMKD
ncbi:SDR family NAD(P)-dependent oxidoreductase [Rhodanobacter sp. MP1X3]|jgi:NAD(P)-dependent dehydrogenase (short-subunit alcohol dehydrogenase family)|uniref:SDR family NAD(P)-dependent oxidoreductase n=1 Tax=Rhodanobacter sp. MP1X3 TaxID=2723086 RepID=UPI00161D1AED|nr:SDR family NAD(P)-dependent oxidoreductase [Rhodanobacter sp. MP1X3]MBB6244021.1 NAD(P)-dependent dehydrogenase (short-subunit alcohol dehydrogenase family) [Rhodanobacter sp. MP1X3]